MARDYFTLAEFRTYAKDPAGPSPKYDDADINRAQAEVIDALEHWARTSWANVTGVDGDGTAAAYRVAVDRFPGGKAAYVLSRYPVSSTTTILVGGVAASVGSYVADLAAGTIIFGSDLNTGLEVLVVTYRYGHGATPWTVKRPAMSAAKSLLDQEEGRGRIPRNVTRYRTETAEFEMRGDEEIDVPWPWDLSASGDVASFWRPAGVTGIRV